MRRGKTKRFTRFSKVIFTDFVLPSFAVVNIWQIIIVNCARVYSHFSSRADECLGLISLFIAAHERRVSRFGLPRVSMLLRRVSTSRAPPHNTFYPPPHVSDLSETTISPLISSPSSQIFDSDTCETRPCWQDRRKAKMPKLKPKLNVTTRKKRLFVDGNMEKLHVYARLVCHSYCTV